MTLHLTDINEFEAVAKIAAQLPDDERANYRAFTGQEFALEDFLVSLSEVASDGIHHIIWAGEEPVAALGFLPQRPGVFRTWFVAPEAVWAPHGAQLTEVCQKLISDLLDGKLAHRVETVTLAEREKARAWYERIGLTYESTLRGYGAGSEDAVMYVAVRDPE